MGLRDTLRTRGLPHCTVPIRAVSSTAVADAEAALADAEAALADAVSTAHRQRVAEAQAAVDDCYTWLTVRALPPAEMEALLAEHPADKDTRTVPFHQATFVPALLARCVFDDPDTTQPAMTEDEWAAESTKGSSSLGEISTLFAACWEVNDRTPDRRIPKGSTTTRS